MIDLKYKYSNNSRDAFVIKIDDTYTIFADNIEDFKRELFDYIESQIDRFVLSKLDEIEEEKLLELDDIDAWWKGIINGKQYDDRIS